MPPDRENNPGARDDGLERELRDLGARIEYPPTPDLASSVKSRLDAEGGSSAPRSGPSLWWVAAAAALVLLMVLPIFSPAARDMAAGVFSTGAGGTAGGAAESGGGAGGGGGREITMESGQRAASVAAGREGTMASVASEAQSDESMAAGAASASFGDAATACADEGECASASPLGEGLGLGEKIPPREARARSEAPILLPRSPRLGKPDEVYARRRASGLTSLYRARWVDRAWSAGLPPLGDTRIGLLLTQTPGDVGAAYLPDGTVEVAGVETVSVNGERGYWIPASGDSPEVARSAGLLSGVLLWELEGQALRLEADVSKERAVRIAESVR